MGFRLSTALILQPQWQQRDTWIFPSSSQWQRWQQLSLLAIKGMNSTANPGLEILWVKVNAGINKNGGFKDIFQMETSHQIYLGSIFISKTWRPNLPMSYINNLNTAQVHTLCTQLYPINFWSQLRVHRHWRVQIQDKKCWIQKKREREREFPWLFKWHLFNSKVVCLFFSNHTECLGGSAVPQCTQIVIIYFPLPLNMSNLESYFIRQGHGVFFLVNNTAGRAELNPIILHKSGLDITLIQGRANYPGGRALNIVE